MMHDIGVRTGSNLGDLPFFLQLLKQTLAGNFHGKFNEKLFNNFFAEESPYDHYQYITGHQWMLQKQFKDT